MIWSIILKYAALIILSVFLAAVSVCFRWKYLKREKLPYTEILKRQKKIFLIILVIYVCFAVLSLRSYRVKGFSVSAMMQFLIFWDAMILIAIIDLKIKRIPNKILLALLIFRFCGIIIESALGEASILNTVIFSVVGMLVGGFFMLTCMFISRGGIGAGDMKLYALVGFYFGLSGIIQVMFYSLLLAAVFSICMLISRKAKMKSTLPMAPFILSGLTVYYLFL